MKINDLSTGGQEWIRNEPTTAERGWIRIESSTGDCEMIRRKSLTDGYEWHHYLSFKGKEWWPNWCFELR